MIESNLPQTWSEKKTSQLTGGGGGGGCKRSMTTDTELGLSNDQFTIVNSDSVPSVCSYYAITDQELAAAVDNGGRNWRGILISFLVIIFICFVIMCAIMLFSPEMRNFGLQQPQMQLITMEEILNGSLIADRLNASFADDKTLLFKDLDGNLMQGQLKDDVMEVSPLIRNDTFRIHSMQKYTFSADRKYLLFAQDLQQQFRHSYKAKYKIFDTQNETVHPILPPGLDESDTTTNVRLDLVNWSPKANALVFVYEGNIYYQSSARSHPVAVTKSDDQLLNGITDWLYEEEILYSEQAIWWSPQGNSFLFARFNDSVVPLFSFDLYGNDDGSHLYPSVMSIKYPKVNQPNPEVKLFIVRVHENTPQSLTDQPVLLLPPPEVPAEHYVTSIVWTGEDSVLVGFSNRLQNDTILAICQHYSNLAGWQCVKHVRLQPTSNQIGWVELKTPIVDLEHRTYFIIHSSMQSERGAFKHIAKVELKNPPKLQFITSGHYEVIKILAHNPQTNVLYFIANTAERPGDRHIYSVDVNTLEKSCLSCQVDSHCRYFSAAFSANASYYLLSCDGPQVPYYQLRHASNNNSLVSSLQNNEHLQEKLAMKFLPAVMSLNVPISGGYNASVKLYLPHNMDFSSVARYPMLIYVYAGPGTQNVNSRFSINWSTYLTTNKQMIYAMIDGRGSGFQGDRLMHELHRRLGTIEIEDQLFVADYLTKAYPFIDRRRLGIWGWSYGGYASAMALAKDDKNLIKCAISVAPVTNWLYYDSAYTERYMGLPTAEDNYVNYVKANLLNKVSKIKSNKLLLIHGSADDNVHLQHSMMLIKALNRFGILYKLQIYPDQDHSLPDVSKHLYSTLNAFVSDCLELDSVYDEAVGLRRKRLIRTNN